MQKRTRYLIAASFQLRFSLFLVGVGVIVTAVVGGVLYLVLDRIQELLSKTYNVLSPNVIDFVIAQKEVYVYSLLFVFTGVTLILLILGIFISHRLAGPIFAISRKMNDLSQGNFNATLQLRKGDEFQGLKDRFNTLVHALQNQVKSELIKVNAIIESLDKLISQKKVPLESESEVRGILRDLRTYYNYKKNLIEPSPSESFKPKDLSQEELIK